MAAAPTIFTAHVDRGGPLRLVPHRFAWAGFWFGPFWLLSQRLWGPSTVVAGIAIATILAARWGVLSAGAAELVWLLVSIFVGLEGHELRRRALIRRGASLAGFAYGLNEGDALAREAFRVGAAVSGRTAS
ncbi:MAG TPA: DUF2628 domain-containing protein [Rhodoblastus sp.]|nr:DUF2628 domain-containing protein [Rhodoblastus sp.]